MWRSQLERDTKIELKARHARQIVAMEMHSTYQSLYSASLVGSKV